MTSLTKLIHAKQKFRALTLGAGNDPGTRVTEKIGPTVTG